MRLMAQLFSPLELINQTVKSNGFLMIPNTSRVFSHQNIHEINSITIENLKKSRSFFILKALY